LKKRTNKFFVTALFTLLLLILVGCTEKKETQDENRKTIEAVLQNSLTGPSDELQQILDKESEEKFEALNQYEEKIFKDYFANETSYRDFVNNYGSLVMIQPNSDYYNFKIKNIEYEKVDANDSVYNFSVELQFQKEGSEKSETGIVTGQANLTDEHKIEGMLIRTKDFWRPMSKEMTEIRDIFVKDGKVLLMVAPDPSLSAGKPYGYIFHFTAPFETFKGKELAIYAYDKETGEKIIGLSPETIKEPSTGYATLERFTVTFAVPKSGLWRYEVVLDGKSYADVVLAVK
jgi:PBP1b-binding outer membrane lipoprotein LpoB